MILNAYAVHDDKGLIFARPFFMPTHGQAMRAFGESCQDPNSMPMKYPSDFRLYFIGTFDEETATLSSLGKPPELLASALEYVKINLETGLNEAGKTYLK